MSVSCLSQLDWNRFFFLFSFKEKAISCKKIMKRTFHRHTPIACDTQYDVLEISWYYICIQPQFQLEFFSFRLMRRCYTFIECFLILWIVFRYLLSQKEGMPVSIQYNRSESKYFSKSLASLQDPLLSFVAILNSLIAYLL